MISPFYSPLRVIVATNYEYTILLLCDIEIVLNCLRLAIASCLLPVKYILPK